MSQCQACSTTTKSGLSLCSACVRFFRNHLESVPWLVSELEITRTRQARFTRPQLKARSAQTPLPWDERVSNVLIDLHATLNAWALETARIAQSPGDPLTQISTDTEDVARWLTRNLATLFRHDEIGVAVNDITQVVSRAMSAIDRPPDLVTYGRCGNLVSGPDGEQECSAYLYATPDARTVRCRYCRATYDVETRKQWMLDYAQGMVGTATEAATYLRIAGVSITADAVRGMARRKRIIAVGHNSEGQPLYRFSAVINAVADRYRRKAKAS